jgi:Zn-dependent protease with chaperone function
VLVCALVLWALIAISIFGAIYAFFIVAFLFFAHVVTIVRIRGSGVKLGEDQLPQLHRRVVELARAAGISRIPDAYVMQEGGALNAFATKFLRSRLIVLYSDLLDACGDDEGARDMVIGHELGHVKSGHLDWMWLIAPARFIPFLGSAYSRACELTCDRWGAALSGDPAAAIRGLVILAAGGKLARGVDLEAFARQRRDLDTGWMTIGRWLSMYPPLSERVTALDPELAARTRPAGQGPARALGIMAGALLMMMLAVGGVTALFMIPALRAAFGGVGGSASPGFDSSLYEDIGDDTADDTAYDTEVDTEGEGFTPPASAEVEVAAQTARVDLERLGALALEWTLEAGAPPESVDEIQGRWSERYGGEAFPRDPFDGYFYGYTWDDTTLRLWSSGPDAESGTDDDIFHVVTWREG